MPYNDPERKKEWERLHRPQRLARRRKLRELQIDDITTPKEALPTQDGIGVLLPVVGGLGALGLAAYQPKLAIGAGGLTLLVAATFKKNAIWWIVGTIILIFGILFFWIEPDEKAIPESA